MTTLEQTLRILKIPMLEDGVISWDETSFLLRAVRPFAARGDDRARELCDLLTRVREDGVVTSEESERIRKLINVIVVGEESLAV